MNNAAVYDPSTDTWTALPDMPTARGGGGVAELGGLLYVAGGMLASGVSSGAVERFDPATGTWATMNSLNTPRDAFAMAATNNRLFVFGGRTTSGGGAAVNAQMSNTEVWNLSTGNWTVGSSLPTARRNASVGMLHGKVQVIGGESAPGGGGYTVVEEWDPLTLTWRTLAPLPTGRHGAAAATIGDTIHLMGGGITGGDSFTSLHSTFWYDPAA
ncbi:hypothetical protein GCM10025876_31620 [Demequina litorisediminis]|uniref:N-acetylneuraminate epimerase n=1 Tax=Demequina litorisediminis TaxID=1849022 RepID=A0ABQ6IIJ6_9MICO|nr:hypothetical protein GCM10025876_31620 [Demequina litorisediminis]